MNDVFFKLNNNNIMKNIFIALCIVAIASVSLLADPINKKTVNTTESTIVWSGKKVTGGHSGTIAIKSGYLDFDGEQLTGGAFEIDMPTLATTDGMGEMDNKLNGHLRSADFFGVEEHPIATLAFTSTMKTDTGYNVTADLTIKGITHPITFDVSISGHNAHAKITVDRTLYKVKYGSGKFFDGLGDKMIYDNFDLDVNLVF